MTNNVAAEAPSFVRPARRELFEEHQRMGRQQDINAHIMDMLRDLYVSRRTFSDRMATKSLLALMNSGPRKDSA